MACMTQLQGRRRSGHHVESKPPRVRTGVVMMQCLKYHQVRDLDIPLGGLSVDPNRRSAPTGPDRLGWESYRPCSGR